MFFAGLFAMWFTSRANGQEGDWAEHTAHINLPMGFLITAVLISSSVTSQFGVFAAERGDVYKLRLWYTVTLVLGVVFLGIMAFEWTRVDSRRCDYPGQRLWLGVLHHHRLPRCARDRGVDFFCNHSRARC